MKSVKNYTGRFSSCYFFNDDSSNNSSRCSNSSPLVGQSSSSSNQCSGDIIPDDTRSISAVNLAMLDGIERDPSGGVTSLISNIETWHEVSVKHIRHWTLDFIRGFGVFTNHSTSFIILMEFKIASKK
jgi:hypothetical protein